MGVMRKNLRAAGYAVVGRGAKKGLLETYI